MKRTSALFIAGFLLLAVISAFGQSQPQPGQGYPKESYVKNIPLIRVMVHPLGYNPIYPLQQTSLAAQETVLVRFAQEKYQHPSR
jgi:hypothetical protein